MDRYSYSFSFIPRQGEVGSYMFYVNTSLWQNDRCINSETVLEVPLSGIQETSDPTKRGAFSVGMIDLAYTMIARYLGDVTSRLHSKTVGHVVGAPVDVSQKM